MIENWKRILSVRAAEWGLPTGGDWNFLFLNTYNAPCPTINLLWFHGEEPFPRVVTKMCRDGASLVEEFRCPPDGFHPVAPRYVPRPMHLGNADGFCMLWMEGVPGRRIPPGQYGKPVLDTSVDMVTSIHRAVNKGKGGPRRTGTRVMVSNSLKCNSSAGADHAVREGCPRPRSSKWRPHSDGCKDLPVIPQHGDLYPDNILRYKDQCHIVDWENFGAIDLPFYDLLTLLIAFLRAIRTRAEGVGPRLDKGHSIAPGTIRQRS